MVIAFVFRSFSTFVLPLQSETNAYSARGRDALPDGDRWPHKGQSARSTRLKNLTRTALLGWLRAEVKICRAR